jgi:diguanylate cyclase (GGDEF)-like protein
MSRLLILLDHLLRGRGRTQLLVFVHLSVIGIGLIDYLTGAEIGLSIFYLLPVAVAAWYTDRRDGVWTALLSCMVWYLADELSGAHYSNALIPVWNAFVRLCFFLTNALLVAALRARLTVEAQLSRTDALTGVMNGRAFAERLELVLANARRSARPFTLAFLDLDDFKPVNDTCGHLEGDRVLRVVGTTLRANLRETDHVARVGGDEFAMLLPDTDSAGAGVALGHARERLLQALRTGQRPVTCSVGAVTFRDRPTGPEQAMKAADALMYTVKERGKNGLALGIYDPALGTAVPASEQPPGVAP